MDELIDKIMSFEVGSADVRLTFLGRLCREQGWTRAYAGRVFQEYKRFIVLAVSTGQPVTPSEDVDHVWHLHLLYTRSYWHKLCRDTIGQEIHHGPTVGGTQEKEKFVDWYMRTLEVYERTFGEAPPRDIWPSSRKRFQYAGEWKIYNAGRYWLVPKWRELFRLLRK